MDTSKTIAELNSDPNAGTAARADPRKRPFLGPFADGLSTSARDYLCGWPNPWGWDHLGEAGERKRRVQEELIAAGLLRIDEDNPQRVRLDGLAAKMPPL